MVSDLQNIAGKLRALAASTDPVASNVIASARKLKSIAAEVESLRRSGIDVSKLAGALEAAITSTLQVEQSVRLVRAEGAAWADSLAARPSGGSTVSASSISRASAPPKTRGRNGWADTLRPFCSPRSNLMLLKALVSPEVMELWLPVAVEASSTALLGEDASEVLTEITDGLFRLIGQGLTPSSIRAANAPHAKHKANED